MGASEQSEDARQTRGRLEEPRPRERLPPRTGRHRRRSRTRRYLTAHERRVETSALRTPLSRSRVRIGGGSRGGLWHRTLSKITTAGPTQFAASLAIRKRGTVRIVSFKSPRCGACSLLPQAACTCQHDTYIVIDAFWWARPDELSIDDECRLLEISVSESSLQNAAKKYQSVCFIINNEGALKLID